VIDAPGLHGGFVGEDLAAHVVSVQTTHLIKQPAAIFDLIENSLNSKSNINSSSAHQWNIHPKWNRRRKKSIRSRLCETLKEVKLNKSCFFFETTVDGGENKKFGLKIFIFQVANKPWGLLQPPFSFPVCKLARRCPRWSRRPICRLGSSPQSFRFVRTRNPRFLRSKPHGRCDLQSKLAPASRWRQAWQEILVATLQNSKICYN
jgi:hypothetical protein